MLQDGVALHQQGRLIEAARIYQEILKEDPNHFDARHLLGVIAYQTRQLDLAVEFISKAISINANFADAHSNLGNALKDLGRANEAVVSYDRAIFLAPDYADAHYNRGVALQELRRFDEAVSSYDKALSLKPTSMMYGNRGVALQALKRHEEALASFDSAIALNPGDAMAYSNRAVALQELKRLDEALASFDKAIALHPDSAEAHNNRGIVLHTLKRDEDALASFDKAIALQPDYAVAFNNRGSVLQDLKKSEEALSSFDKAIALKPDYAEAYYNRGSLLHDLNKLEEAIACYDKAIALKPDYAEAYSNRGYILYELEKLYDALEDYDQAIRLKPDYALAYANSGSVFRRLRLHDEAARKYEAALALDRQYPFAKGMLLHEKMMCCDWAGIDELIAEIDNDIAAGRLSAEPFGWQGVSRSQRSLQLCAQLYTKEKYPPAEGELPRLSWGRREKIRIGYLSGEFRDQATSHLLVGLLEQHDKSRFEVYIIDNGWDDQSEIRQRINASADSVANIKGLADRIAASVIQESQVDILVNLNGYFGSERNGIFARRCSPIQVNYLGFPGTLGANYIDYILADECVVPEDHKPLYQEKVAYLPHCYQANDDKKEISNRVLTRSEAGLPEDGFVFCCFNNAYKVTPDRFDIWMRVLKEVEGSVLWVLDVDAAADNLRKEAELRGVKGNRIVFAPIMKLPDHLVRHRLADLFLDTLPCNAHTTASDALWAGLPLLTQIGETFSGRVAASLLTAIGLPELITQTPQEYEALAIELASNPEKLAAIKSKLADNRTTTPLFNTVLFAKHVEAAYAAMYERYHAGLSPDHIYIDL